jgi:ATP-dependent Clp protease ATP-binding subunit ClpA/ATP-dependent Clp protease ATP-binding subunit ClpC
VSSAEVIESHLTKRRAFDQALEAGADPLPANPESLLPIVRAIRFDPPRRRGQVAPLTIEDYGLADARHAETASPLEVLSELLSVRMTKLDDPKGGSRG